MTSAKKAMIWTAVTIASALFSPEANADWRSRAATETAESLMARFGARAGTSVPALAGRIETLAARYGDEAILAVRKGGPEAVGLVEAAGADGAKAVRVLAKHGEEGAARVLARPVAMKQFLRYGDEAASALVKHPGVAESVVERAGAPAVKALEAISPRNGRRLAMVLEDDLARTGRQAEVMEVIAKYGDPAMEFIWNHKGSLAVASTLAAFLAKPEKFLDTAQGMTKTMAENAVRPLAEAPAAAVKEVAAGTNWTVVFCLAVTALGGLAAFRLWLKLRA